MRDTEYLFLKTIDELEGRLLMTDPYEVLMTSGLIRKMFLDNVPLADQVNRKYRKKIYFEVGVKPPEEQKFKPSSSFYFWSHLDAVDPDSAGPGKKWQVNRDTFFKIPVIGTNTQRYTIKDIVLFSANIMGAVHAGTPKTEKHSILKEMNGKLMVGGYAPTIRQLKSIGRVVNKALAPLRVEVQRNFE